jgi:hypothetical protein
MSCKYLYEFLKNQNGVNVIIGVWVRIMKKSSSQKSRDPVPLDLRFYNDFKWFIFCYFLYNCTVFSKIISKPKAQGNFKDHYG